MLAVLPWAVGCGDGGTEPLSPDPPRATTLTVTPATAERTALGATVQLTAEVRDQNGNVMSGATVSWSSSAPAVAAVDGSGMVTAAGNGTATITATAGSASGSTTVTVVENPDRAALVALYEATEGPNWVNSENWLTDAPLGDWYGVDTDGSGRVVALNLAGKTDRWPDVTPHGLEGPIPPEIGSLASLRRLSLAYNHLTGPIPPELGNLANLTRLDLGHNFLSGPVPTELGELASLTGLWLYSNSLTGPIPTELGSLTDLESLILGDNDLTGPIPTELGELASLTWLGLYSNSLTGPIPLELGNLANLTRLDLRYNDLTGPIPESFLELEALEEFRFERNADLCAPGTIDFVTWLERVETVSGPYCNESDVEALELLFETAGGTGWTRADGWRASHALEEWHGVTADTLGQVEALDLGGNGLAGEMPDWPRGALAHMTELRIGANAGLAGRLPLSLADLSLRVLHYAGTGLCAPADAAFTRWLNAISSHQGTGGECAPHFTGLITPYPIHTHYLGDVSEENKRTIDAAALEWGRILNPTPAASFTFDETVDCWGSDWGSRSWSRGEDTTKYLRFNAGDTLAPGLHLYFKHPPGPRYAGRNGVYASGCASSDPYTFENRPPIVTIKSVAERGTSDVPMSPIGIIGIGPEGRTISRATALHEIGHILGIGEELFTIDKVDDKVIEKRGRWGKWIKQLDPSEPRNIYLTDPKVIAVFDRMGGTGFPETTPKIPLRTPHHWDGCSGHGDVMSYGLTREEYEAATITELSAAALQEGYVYDPGQIDTSVRLNPLRWNSESSSWTCRDGQRAWPGAAQSLTTDGTFTDLHNGIIYEFDPR